MIAIDKYDDRDDEGWDHDPDDETDEPCPHCGESVYDDAELCPYCGSYLSREETSPRKPWWVVAGSVACLLMVTWWILHP